MLAVDDQGRSEFLTDVGVTEWDVDEALLEEFMTAWNQMLRHMDQFRPDVIGVLLHDDQQPGRFYAVGPSWLSTSRRAQECAEDATTRVLASQIAGLGREVSHRSLKIAASSPARSLPGVTSRWG